MNELPAWPDPATAVLSAGSRLIPVAPVRADGRTVFLRLDAPHVDRLREEPEIVLLVLANTGSFTIHGTAQAMTPTTVQVSVTEVEPWTPLPLPADSLRQLAVLRLRCRAAAARPEPA